jgi:hypothetical protein
MVQEDQPMEHHQDLSAVQFKQWLWARRPAVYTILNMEECLQQSN